MDNTILAKKILQITRHGYYEEQVEKIAQLLDSITSASNGENSVISGSLLSQAKELFAKLTNDERIEVSSDYCKYCGQNEAEFGKCYCAPCYDE